MRFPFALGLVLGAGLGFLGGAALYRQDAPKKEEEQVAAADGEPEETKGTRGKRRGKKRGKRSGKDLGFQEIDERIVLSAADRKLVWRGDAVSLPKQDLEFGSGGGGGGSLDQSQINAGIGPAQDDLSRCIGEARGAAEIAATITLKFLVDGNGRVSKSRVKAPAYLHKNGLLSCSRRALKSMRFDQTGGHTVVTLPFDLDF